MKKRLTLDLGFSERRCPKGVDGSSGNLGGFKASNQLTLARTTPFGFLVSSGKSSINSVSVSEWTTFDDPASVRSLRRRVAGPSCAIRSFGCFRLRESSESSASTKLRGHCCVSSVVRSIDCLGADVDWVFGRLDWRDGFEKTAAPLLGFPVYLMPELALELSLKRGLLYGLWIWSIGAVIRRLGNTG